LGRLEARVALEELIPLLSATDAVETDPPMIDSYVVRGRSRLLFNEVQRGEAVLGAAQ
jgi:hypothetical protein